MGSLLSEDAISLRALEVGLPDATLPRAMTADRSGQWIYAVVTARQAAKITDQLIRESEEAAKKKKQSRADGPTARPSRSSPVPPDPVPNVSAINDWAIVRYEGLHWVYDRDVPKELDLTTEFAGLLADGQTLHLLFGAGHRASEISHIASAAPRGAWSPARRVEIPGGASLLSTGWLEDQPVIVLGVGEALSRLVQPWRWDGGQWLPLPAIDVPIDLESVTAAPFDADLALGGVIPEKGAAVGLWSISKGDIKEPLALVPAISTSPFPQLRPLTRAIGQWTVLMLVFLFLFLWRRDRVLAVLPIESGQRLAYFVPRLAALFIDLLIVAPLWGPLIYALWLSDDRGLTPLEQLLISPKAPGAGVTWGPALVGAVYGLYAVVFELAIRATPGKRLFGCCVVAEGGGRCSSGAVVIRNILRIVEFHILPIVLLVILTPGRQRLGDLVARTIVVQRDSRETPDRPTGSDETADADHRTPT